jgi:CubicO group peptidase (beta-lactamase class C family)
MIEIMKIQNKISGKLIINISVIVMFVIMSSCHNKKDSKKDSLTIKSKVSLVNSIMKPIDDFILQKMEENKVIGLGAAIIVDKELVWSKGFGYANKEKQIPFSSNTVMCIASISKTFTGVAIMKALEEELVSLDEDINTYLPFKVINPNFPNEKITLRHLATHTSGLTDDYDIYDKTYNYSNKESEALGVFLKSYFTPKGKNYSKKNFLNKKPGTYRDYSNIAAGLAGYIIELQTGKSLNEYGSNKIFEPLKMKNTSWSLSETDLNNHSIQYEKEKDSIKIIPLYSLTTYPDGGVRTSVSDLSKFFISLLNEGKYKDTRILKKEIAREMLRFQFIESNKPENINLKEPNKNSGIFWATKRDVTLIGHGGSDFGVSTDMFCDTNKEVGIIIFSNTGEADTYDIFNELWKYGKMIRKATN